MNFLQEQNQLQESQQFVQDSIFWSSEIRGNIARLNDAAAAVETDMLIPSRFTDEISIGHKIDRIRDFHFEIRRLYKNSKQVLPDGIKKTLEAWLKSTKSEKSITNLSLLDEGLKIIDELQDVFYEIGLKDIGQDDPEMFPYDFYEDSLDECRAQ